MSKGSPTTGTRTPHIEVFIKRAERDKAVMPVYMDWRYPLTYAYDFMREHSDVFDGHTGRAECARWLYEHCEITGEDKSDVAEKLADAYCRQHGIVTPWTDLDTESLG